MSFVTDALSLFERLFGGDAQRKRQRVKLLGALLDDKSNGSTGIRSLDTLTLKSGMTPEDCRALLAEMGCEGVTMKDGREGWRRIKT